MEVKANLPVESKIGSLWHASLEKSQCNCGCGPSSSSAVLKTNGGPE